MAVVNLNKPPRPRWAVIVLAKLEKLAQSAAYRDRILDVVTLERAMQLIAEGVDTTAPPAASEDAVDAERYRWLRRTGVSIDPSKPWLYREDADSAIDAARDGEGVG